MDKKKIVLLLDVDGVFTIYRGRERDHWFAKIKLSAWPIPQHVAILRAIADNSMLYPVWLSAWDDSSVLWNELSQTRHFPVAYHLKSRQERHARHLFPYYSNVDTKLVAVQYYLRRYPMCDVVWVEDGFAVETWIWAQDNPKVALLDASEDPVRSLLLREDAGCVQELMSLILGE